MGIDKKEALQAAVIIYNMEPTLLLFPRRRAGRRHTSQQRAFAKRDSTVFVLHFWAEKVHLDK